jgi:hypothetical protein
VPTRLLKDGIIRIDHIKFQLEWLIQLFCEGSGAGHVACLRGA